MNKLLIAVYSFVVILAVVILLFLLIRRFPRRVGAEYLVQNLNSHKDATNLLDIIHRNIMMIRDHLEKHMDDYPEYKKYLKFFCEKIKDIVIYENPPNGKYTSYTVNKGDEIAICLRSKKGKLHDLNLVMYVVLHELAHVVCPEVDHTELFKELFVFLLKIAIKLDIYKEVDYQINPHEYCGLTISENLLNDK
jgi:hypothetical protein